SCSKTHPAMAPRVHRGGPGRCMPTPEEGRQGGGLDVSWRGGCSKLEHRSRVVLEAPGVNRAARAAIDPPARECRSRYAEFNEHVRVVADGRIVLRDREDNEGSKNNPSTLRFLRVNPASTYSVANVRRCRHPRGSAQSARA